MAFRPIRQRRRPPSPIAGLGILLILAWFGIVIEVFGQDLRKPNPPQTHFPFHASGKIVIGFDDSLAECAHCIFESRRSPSRALTVDRIRRIKPVFRNQAQEEKIREQYGITESIPLSLLKNDWESRCEKTRAAKNPQRTNAIATVLPPLYHIYRMDLEEGISLEETLIALSSDPSVRFAQPDFWIEAHAETIPQKRKPLTPILWPNDPYFHSSNSWGQEFADLWGLQDDKLGVRVAWNQSQGAEVLVAVVDSGLDYNHPDIAANVAWNAGERPFANGIDDDGNGYIDDRRGWDFTTCAVADPFSGNCLQEKLPDNDPMDGHGHGTHVSGTIAAVKDNGIGIVGVAPKAKILPLKAMNDQGSGLSSELAEALVYAAMNGADIINNSWGCRDRCPSNLIIEEAVKTASDLGCVLVFSAGNSSDESLFYSPQNMAQTITVGASSHLDQRASFSNFGIELDLCAPGGEPGTGCSNIQSQSILSLRSANTDLYSLACNGNWAGQMLVGENYLRARGTSMSSPHVSGVAALLLALHPDWNAEQIRQALRVSAKDISLLGPDSGTGFGRVDAAKAVLVSSVLQTQLLNPSSSKSFSTVEESIPVFGNAFGDNFSEYQLSFSPATALENWQKLADPISTPVQNDLLGIWDIHSLETGMYRLRLQVNPNGETRFQDTVQVFIEKGVERWTQAQAWQWGASIWNQRIAWIDTRDLGNLLDTGIYVLDRATGEETRITDRGSYSPSLWENFLVWQDRRQGNWDIYFRDLAGNGIDRVISNAPGDQVAPKIFENWIVWTDFRSGNADIYAFDLSQNIEIPLTHDSFAHSNPAIWGQTVVWENNRNGNQDIYSINLNTGEERQITTDPADQSSPSIWEHWIVWQDLRNGTNNPDIYLFDLNSGIERAISTSSSHQSRPRIFDHRIVWQDDRNLGFSTDIYLYDLLAERERAVTTHFDSQSSPSIWGDEVIWEDFRNGQFDLYSKQDTALIASIDSPVSGAVILREETPLIEIRGKAFGEGIPFSHYQLFYRAASDESGPWIPLGEIHHEAVIQGLLSNWDISNLPTDQYLIRLLVTPEGGLPIEKLSSFYVQPAVVYGITDPPQNKIYDSDQNLVVVKGRAGGIAFSNYQIFYGLGKMPESWIPLTEIDDRPIFDDAMLAWHTEDVEEGWITLRLVVTATSGEEVEKLRSIYLDKTTRQLINDASIQRAPAIFGHTVVWEDNRNGNFDIYTIDLNSLEQRQLTSLSSVQRQPSIYGNRVVWTDLRNGNSDIYLLNLDTNEETQITSDSATQITPAISENTIVWIDYRNTGQDIYSYNIETGQELRITPAPTAIGRPSVSNRRIVWIDKRNEGQDVYLYDLDTQQEQRITTAATAADQAEIFGNLVIWQDVRDGYRAIYSFNLETGIEQKLTNEEASVSSFAIYGSKIVWSDGRNGDSDLYLLDFENLTEQRLTFVGSDQDSPAVFENTVIWVDDRNGNPDIYLLELE